MSTDIRVLPSFAVEVVGGGEPSDSGWEFGSQCGSVAVSGVSVGFFSTAVLFSLSKKRNFACVETRKT